MRTTVVVAAIGLLFVAFALSSALAGRWRDAFDAAVPALLLSGVVVLAWRRTLAQRRRDLRGGD